MPTDEIEMKDIIMEAMKMAIDGEWESANKLIVTHTMKLDNKISKMQEGAQILKDLIEEDVEIDS